MPRSENDWYEESQKALPTAAPNKHWQNYGNGQCMCTLQFVVWLQWTTRLLSVHKCVTLHSSTQLRDRRLVGLTICAIEQSPSEGSQYRFVSIFVNTLILSTCSAFDDYSVTECIALYTCCKLLRPVRVLLGRYRLGRHLKPAHVLHMIVLRLCANFRTYDAAFRRR